MASKSVHVIGLCHELFGTLDFLARLFHLEESELNYEIAGINHFIWLTKLQIKGEDRYSDIRSFASEHLDGMSLYPEMKADHKLAWEAPTAGPSTWFDRRCAKLALLKTYGLLPCAGDRHLVEFIPAMLNAQNDWGKKWKVYQTTIAERHATAAQTEKKIHAWIQGEQEIPWKRSREEFSLIIRDLEATRQGKFIMNLPNQGQIKNLPDHVIVETMGHLTPTGPVALQAGGLPQAMISQISHHICVQELTVQAAMEGSRDLLLQAIL